MSGTILRRWKRNWFDLWADGRLVFYDDQQRRDMEDDIHMRVDCINIRSSTACQGTYLNKAYLLHGVLNGHFEQQPVQLILICPV